MKTRYAVAALAVTALCSAQARAQEPGSWTFSDLERIELDGVSGDLVVAPSSDGAFHLSLDQRVRPTDAFQGEVRQQETVLRIRERWSGNRSSGSVRWTLEVPAGSTPVVSMDTSSGDLDVTNVTARYNFDTASGDVRIEGGRVLDGSSFDTASGDYVLRRVAVGDDVDLDAASGDVELTDVQAGRGFKLSTASGDLRLESSQGILDGSTASGDVHVYDRDLSGSSRFSSASGDVMVRLSGTLSHDLEASSASGDVDLSVGSFPSSFTLILVKRQNRGQIDCPFEYTSEETFERDQHTYVRKTVKRGTGGPTIQLQTASGNLSVRGG